MKTKYIVELTEEEAVSLALVASSSDIGLSRVGHDLRDIGVALIVADPELCEKQFEEWQKSDYPEYDLTRGPQI